MDLLYPMLVLQAAAEREENSWTLLSPQNPNLKVGVGQGEQGAFHPQNRNCGEQGHTKHECLGGKEHNGGKLVGRGRVLQNDGIWGDYGWMQKYGQPIRGEMPAVALGENYLYR